MNHTRLGVYSPHKASVKSTPRCRCEWQEMHQYVWYETQVLHIAPGTPKHHNRFSQNTKSPLVTIPYSVHILESNFHQSRRGRKKATVVAHWRHLEQLYGLRLILQPVCCSFNWSTISWGGSKIDAALLHVILEEGPLFKAYSDLARNFCQPADPFGQSSTAHQIRQG